MRALLPWTLMLLLACSGSESASESESESESATESESESATESESASDDSDDEDDEEPARVFETAEDGAPMIEPAIGQWVRYGVTWREGGRSTTEYRFVDRQNDTWWFEITDRRGNRQNHVRMQVRRDGDEVELLALSFHKQGQPREDVQRRLLPAYEPMLAQWLQMLFPGPLTGEPEEVSVRAGTFPDARRSETTLEFGGQRIDADIWRHPTVPVTGMVKFRDQSGGHTVELLAFGLEGARSAF
jgi:hypothetical protein